MVSFFYQAESKEEACLRKKDETKARSSEQERRVDARALIADEGRDKLR